MKNLGGNGITWFMLSGYLGLHTWLSTQDLYGCHCLGVHLWMDTQEQRDYHVFLALVSFQCSLMTIWALS
jgi:hypothetical protein